ncbi:hypothetical protein EHW67_16690 [Arenibacter aquaticus]|uniref:Uncharacterized protein n=1 Tax=Arenibacter aquaticus TaxID=2489054 RepID=A0A3S0BUG0_9FLAO|nr:hypothetical protein EHW67_16690 [Arenibacter aquaticus]
MHLIIVPKDLVNHSKEYEALCKSVCFLVKKASVRQGVIHWQQYFIGREQWLNAAVIAPIGYRSTLDRTQDRKKIRKTKEELFVIT